MCCHAVYFAGILPMVNTIVLFTNKDFCAISTLTYISLSDSFFTAVVLRYLLLNVLLSETCAI